MMSLYPDWHREALCLGESDILFFGASEPDVRPPYTTGAIRRARQMCASCPVAAECLRAALRDREEYGVWAGTTRKQRKEMLAMIDEGVATLDELIDRFEAKRGR